MADSSRVLVSNELRSSDHCIFIQTAVRRGIPINAHQLKLIAQQASQGQCTGTVATLFNMFMLAIFYKVILF